MTSMDARGVPPDGAASPLPGGGWAGGTVAPGTRTARFGLVRRVEAGGALETVLVSAVATLLGIRAYLQATGFPQVGGGGLHIAHMLWGGLLMLIALVLALIYIGRPARFLAAVVGGAGFGTFIDELGKFITRDHDYFFRPTAGLLYVIFVLLFLSFRAMDRHRPGTREGALANAADALPELVVGGATEAERARVLRLLDSSGASGPLLEAARAFVVAVPAATEGKPSLPAQMAMRGQRTYERLISAPWFGRAVVFIFLTTAIVGGIGALLLGLVVLVGTGAALAAGGMEELQRELVLESGQDGWGVTIVAMLAALASLVCSVIGALALRRSRLKGLLWFRRSVLIALLLSLPIQFLDEQFWALSNVAFNLLLWIGVSYLIRQEAARLDVAAGK
jgi:hypothetical protein